MKIKEMFRDKKKPLLSFEIFPPKKDKELESIDEVLETLCGLHPDFISVTCGAGGGGSKNTVELAKKVKRFGVEPLVHLTCIHNDREEILSVLQRLKAEGIGNILALRGDVVPEAPVKKEFAHAADLIRFVREQGDFGIGAACYPETHTEAPDAETDIRNLKAKTDAGAEHLITQLFLDNAFFYDFRDRVRAAGIHLPLEAGIMPVTGKAQIEKMVHLCGASLPGRMVKILDKYGDNKEALFDAGIAYAVEQIVDLAADHVDGIHIFTMNHPAVAGRICEGIRSVG